MAKLIKTKDWSATPLGPISGWPQSLRTVVSLAQGSNSPISLVWGPGHVQIYNDGYWPICGAKHPVAMGQDFRECWASAFPVIGEAYEIAWTGRSAYLETMRMFLDRYGFLEETWFTFSFSPITDETGQVAGLFHPVTEMTSQMLSERRTLTLRNLTARAGRARSSDEALAFCAEVLAESAFDIPFAACYRIEAGAARFAAGAGLGEAPSACPASVDLAGGDGGPWAIADVARTGTPRQIDDVAALLGVGRVGPYPETPSTAFALPIHQPGSTQPAGVLVAGVSARLRLDEQYRSFLDLAAAAVSTAYTNARAYEQERERAELLAQLDRAKTSFFSNVSHELRTPLTLILGPVEDAIGRPERRLQGPDLEAVHHNAVRLLRLVNSLLDFARIEAGRYQMAFTPVDLATMTADLASSFRSLFDRAGVALKVECPPLPEPIYVEPGQWEKIVLNLVSNAFKFTLTGEVSVTQRWLGDRVELAVQDTGEGIPAAELPRIFERFHRVEGAKGRSFEGTGIGLSLVHELVKLHGGTIDVSSVEGSGTTFRVSIPSGRAHVPAERMAPELAGKGPGAGTSPFVLEAAQWVGGAGTGAGAEEGWVAEDLPTAVPAAVRLSPGVAMARVLVVDDNTDMREYLTRLLSPHWEVMTAPNGESALATIRGESVDLILTDVMMPGLDGVGLLNAVRADARTQGIPVILLSARAGEESVLQGLASGADDYLVKPFSARELIARVATHLEMARLRRQWAAELEQANRELEAFNYSVSHDLRSPLRAIDGFSRELSTEYAEVLDERGRHYLDRVRAAAQRMGLLIDALLSLSRVSRAPVGRSVVDVTEMATAIVTDLRQRAPTRDVDVRIAPGLTARADPQLLRVALENLLGNAWKFTSRREGARIEVGETEKSHRRVFFVRDNGAGFDMAAAARLFAPFQRLHADKEYEGTGIGLATVNRIVTRHGGRIWAEATRDQGATFYFEVGEP